MNIKTTRFEHFLLAGVIVVLALEESMPTVGGKSLSFLLFGGIAAYLVLWRPHVFTRIWCHPIFLASYALLGIGVFMELAHYSFAWPELFRIGSMVVGAILVAALCRDRESLQAGLYGFVFSSVYVSLVLFFSSYEVLASAQVQNYQEASHLRDAAVLDNPLKTNANQLGFIIAQGAVVALVLALAGRTVLQRVILFGICAFCFIGTFLPISRSGVIILFVASGAVMYVKGIVNPRVIIGTVLMLGVMALWVPDAIWTRFTVSTEVNDQGRVEDSRVFLYGKVAEHLPDVVLTGVGINHYYGKWGERHGFDKLGIGVIGTHNCFTQVAMYWGVFGVLALLALFYQACKYLPPRYDSDPLRLAILGLSVAMLLKTLIMHQLYDKGFTLTFGLLVGTSYWVWPYLFRLKRLHVKRQIVQVFNTAKPSQFAHDSTK